ncbi:D-allose transport system permease protein AlsC [subsurface metagenome]
MPANQQDQRVSEPRARRHALRIIGNENFVLAIVLIVIMGVMGVLTKGLFLTPTNIRNLLLRTCIVGVAAVGQAFVVLSAGIDLSVGGVTILSSCLGAGLMTANVRLALLPDGAYLPMAAGIVIMVLVGIGVGAVNGFSVSRLRMSPLIVTIAIWQITKGAAYQLTHRGQLIMKLPDSLAFFGQGNIGGVPVPIIIFILAIVIGNFVLNYTTFGRFIYAVGGNEASAWLSGIKVQNIRLWVYVVSGFCVGLAAIIALSRVMCGSTSVVIGLELDSIAAVIIGGVSLFGGKGSMIGVLIGVLILAVMDNAMNIMELVPHHQMMIKGAVIIAAVAMDVWRRRR